jgi:protoheme IX farnesyltransferase
VKLKDYLQLSKIRIMLPVAFTGFTGYFIFKPELNASIILVSLGILLQAVASSVLNQVQEIDLDRKMNRTLNRPLPSGRISLNQALIFLSLCFITGSLLIYFFGNRLAALIGLFTIFWYNIVYTYSKRITAFAVVPGSLTGALPPFIGWAAAGGAITDKNIILLGFLLFIGQIPHFWLLVLKYGEEYGNAGIPSLTKVFSHTQINRLSFTWIVCSAIAALFLSWFGVIRSRLIIGFLLVSTLLLVWSMRVMIIKSGTDFNFRRNFILLNSYYLLILIFLIADRIISDTFTLSGW